MNERIRELATQAHLSWCMQNDFDQQNLQKFAELIVADTVNVLKQEWYDRNNAPEVENETPRDVGLRVGAKSQTIRLIHVIKKHFGIE